MPAEADYIGGDLTDELHGAVIEYTYTKGNHYRLTFDHDNHVTFAFLNAPGREPGAPPFVAPSLVYRARKIRDGQVFVHWIVQESAIHVSLIIDLTEKRVHAGAMMPPNRWEFFDTATLQGIEYR
jgi:hypothetical protein